MKKKCLVFFTVGIGDSLMVLPALEKVKELGTHELHALCMSRQTADIAINSDIFTSVHFVDFLRQPFSRSISAVMKLRKEKFDRSVLVFPSNHFKYQIVHYMIGAEERYGISYKENMFPSLTWMSGKLLEEDRALHAVEHNYRLFEMAFGTKLERSGNMRLGLSQADRSFSGEFISSSPLAGKTLIGIHAGSDVFKNMEKKRWPAEKYSGLIKSFAGNAGIHFVLFGGPDENGLNERICNDSGGNCTVLKNVSFYHSASVIEKCSLFVCGDTGLMHTASALKVPVISVFGPTSPVYTRPLNEGSEVISMNYPCSPCFEYSRKHLKCGQERKYKCLEDITAEQVAQVIKRKLNLSGV